MCLDSSFAERNDHEKELQRRVRIRRSASPARELCILATKLHKLIKYPKFNIIPARQSDARGTVRRGVSVKKGGFLGEKGEK